MNSINMYEDQDVQLLKLLVNKSKNTKDIYLEEAIHGVIDFSVLEKKGFKSIEQIHLGNGKITQILNLPDTLKILQCGNNLLSSLPTLPSTLEELDVSHNMLSSLDLKEAKNLKVLNASNNQLCEVINFPESMETIILNENNITYLDLEGLINLIFFESKNNIGIVLRNVPDNLEINLDYKIPKIQDGGSKPDLVDYIEALNEYFSLKTQYEVKLLNVKRDYKQAKKEYILNNRVGKIPKMKDVHCVRCKKIGGNIFSKNKNIYQGNCGNKNNMCFEIKIDNNSDKTYDINVKLKDSMIANNKIKESIMVHKMDVFFNYTKIVDSKNSVDSHIVEYMKYNQEYEGALQQYNEIYSNKGRKESIIAEITIIEESNNKIDSLNVDYLVEIVPLQIELGKEYEKLRGLKYDVTDMEIIMTAKDGDIIGSRLIQKEIDIRKTFIVNTEPKVLKYNLNVV